MGRIWARLLRISPSEVSFERRGFRAAGDTPRERLEEVGRTFLAGYSAALRSAGVSELGGRLAAVEPELRGFAFEGAGMALSLLDGLTPGGRRLRRFLAGPGATHVYLVHVGAGWALGRLPLRVGPFVRRLDPLLGWLALDGYGFHQGYFHWPSAVVGQRVPRKVRGYARRAFDQGLGRSLWFVEGAGAAAIAAAIAAFPPSRRDDLWAGVGLAAAYAGGVDRARLGRLRELAAPHLAALAQGAAFAAQARRWAGNPTPHTELACEVLCGLSAEQAAEVTDRARDSRRAGGPEPAFEEWRRRVQQLVIEEGIEPCRGSTALSPAEA